MKVKLKNNANLQLQSIQNKTAVTSLYITGCPGINTWNIFNSIYTTSGNTLRSIRLDGINHTGTWSELQNLKRELHGLDSNGTEISVPSLIGTWTLPGMHQGEQDLEAEETAFGGTLNIVVDKTLVSFTDNTVESIVNSLWGFEYDNGLYGVDTNLIRSITDIGQNFMGTNIVSFPEFELFESVITLSNNAFANCTSLTTINLAPHVVTIGDNVFSGCSSLTSITYPATTSVIGSGQTTGCTNLQYVHLLRSTSVPSIQSDSFPGNYKIYVGDGTSPWHDNRILNSLLADNTWKLYENRLDTWYNKIYTELVPAATYGKLDYIESDALNYITVKDITNDTNIAFTDNTRFVADISFISSEESIYGSAQSGLRGLVGGGLSFKVITKSNNAESPVNFANASTWIGSGENLYDIDIKNGLISFNGTSILNAQIKSNGGNITLFGDASHKYIGRTWMTRVYENDVLTHDFVPVYKKSTSEAGLYDAVSNTFSGFTTYSGDGFDTRLISESKRRITTENDDYILVSNTNTDKIKVSKMDQSISYTDYFIPVVKSGVGNKKYNLGALESETAKLSSMAGLTDFSTTNYYNSGQFVSYQGNAYKFINNHVGAWNDTDVIRTSVFDELSVANKVQNKETLNLQLISNSPTYLDWIKSTGTQYINTGLSINNSTNYTIELKFKYDNFVSNGYIFGDYYNNTNYNMTRLMLGTTNNGSGVCSMGSKANGGSINIPAGVLTAGVDHTVTLSSGSVTIDGNTYTGSVVSGSNNSSTLGIFAGSGTGTSISQLGITLYYFKIRTSSTYIYDLRPAIRYGNIGLSREGGGDQTFYWRSGHDFEIPSDFSGGIFSNKTLDINFEDGSDSIHVLTNVLGKATTSFRRDKNFTVSLNNIPSGYNITESTYRNCRDIDNIKYCLVKNTIEEMCTVNINISLSNGSDVPSSFGGKVVYMFDSYNDRFTEGFTRYTIYGSTVVSAGKATVSISFPKNRNALILFPAISGYTKPENMTITTNSNEKTVEATYIVA